MSPNVDGIVRNEDGDIAHDLNAEFGCSRFECGPLSMEEELCEFSPFDFVVESVASGFESVGVAVAQALWPGRPNRSLGLFSLQSIEECEIVEPIGVFFAERFKLLPEFAMDGVGRVDEASKSRLDQFVFVVASHFEFGAFGMIGDGGVFEIFERKQAIWVIAEVVEVDESGVCGECRCRIVWATAVVGGDEREHLPDLLASIGKELQKVARRFPDRTDARSP